jgi:hypothetical protein
MTRAQVEAQVRSYFLANARKREPQEPCLQANHRCKTDADLISQALRVERPRD